MVLKKTKLLKTQRNTDEPRNTQTSTNKKLKKNFTLSSYFNSLFKFSFTLAWLWKKTELKTRRHKIKVTNSFGPRKTSGRPQTEWKKITPRLLETELTFHQFFSHQVLDALKKKLEVSSKRKDLQSSYSNKPILKTIQ